MHDLDMILGMDWLAAYKAKVDYFKKEVTFQLPDGREIHFVGERHILPSCLISTMTATRLLRNGCEAYLASIVDMEL